MRQVPPSGAWSHGTAGAGTEAKWFSEAKRGEAGRSGPASALGCGLVTEPGAVALKRTPLEDEHRALGAKIGAFAGWAMPIDYRGTLAEHQAVRERVGLFDLMHLGKVIVSGPGGLGSLQRS